MAKHIFVTGGVVSSLGKGPHQCVDRHAARKARPLRADAEARSVHQRRSRHDEPLSARRSLRARRRQRNRPRSRPLRALHAGPADPRFQLHHRPNLPVGHQQGAARRLPRQDRPGHPAHHQRNQKRHRQARRGSYRTRRRRHHRNRRHGRRHRKPALSSKPFASSPSTSAKRTASTSISRSCRT